jgi:predicted transcriptional regulator
MARRRTYEISRGIKDPGSLHHGGITWYHCDMAMTLRLPDELETELKAAAAEDRRSVQATIILALEAFLASRETAEIKADPDALRSLAEAREAVRDGDVVYGVEAVQTLLRGRRAS